MLVIFFGAFNNYNIFACHFCRYLSCSSDLWGYAGLQGWTPPLLSSVEGKRHPCVDGKLQANWLLDRSNAEYHANMPSINLLRQLHNCSACGELWAAISTAPEAPAPTPFIGDSEAFNFKSLHFEGNLLVRCSVFVCYFILLQFSFEMPCTLFLLLELDILLW